MNTDKGTTSVNNKNGDLDFSKHKDKSNEITTQYLSFEMGQETYGIKLTDNKEIIKPPRITSVPNTDSYVKGVINLRGQIVPVLDLKKKLNLTNKEDNKKNKIIVVQVEGILLGLMVDKIQNVVRISKDELEEINENRGGVNREFIEGVFTSGENLVIIIDIKNILFEENKKIKKEVKHA